MKKLKHVPTGIEGEFWKTFTIEAGPDEFTQIYLPDNRSLSAPSSEFVTVIDESIKYKAMAAVSESAEPKKPFLINPFFWVILILFLAVVFLANSNRNLRNRIEATETNKRLTETQNRIDSIEQAKTAITSKIITNSEDNATRANNLVKSIKNEKPIITDTTHAAMYEYVRNYRPE